MCVHVRKSTCICVHMCTCTCVNVCMVTGLIITHSICLLNCTEKMLTAWYQQPAMETASYFSRNMSNSKNPFKKEIHSLMNTSREGLFKMGSINVSENNPKNMVTLYFTVSLLQVTCACYSTNSKLCIITCN